MDWLQIADHITNGKAIYEEGRFWAAIGGAFWFAFSKYNDIKSKFGSMESGVHELKTEVKEQTTSFVTAMTANTNEVKQSMQVNTNEIKEMRGDLKLVTGALMTPPQIRARAAKRKK